MSIVKSALYVVATPLGNPHDISRRALDTLAGVDLVAAEDTRRIKRLLQYYNISAACISLHEHNESQASAQVVKRLQAGQAVALVSDAGTPLISDPGYELIRLAQQAALRIIPVPGPSALTTALSVAGLPNDRFVFEGFLPARGTARRQRLEQLCGESRTLIFYESSHRIVESLQDMQTVFGDQRRAVVARELTKQFETIQGDTLAALVQWVTADPNQRKGEFVVLVQGLEHVDSDAVTPEAEQLLQVLLEELPIKKAAKLAARITGLNKRALYDRSEERRVGKEGRSRWSPYH